LLHWLLGKETEFSPFAVVEFVIERADENGGTISFKDYASLEQAFARKVSPDEIANSPYILHINTITVTVCNSSVGQRVSTKANFCLGFKTIEAVKATFIIVVIVIVIVIIIIIIICMKHDVISFS